MAGAIGAEHITGRWNRLVEDEYVTDEDIKMEDLSLHANPQCDDQNHFEPKKTPPQGETLISENPDKQLNIAPDEEVEDFEDGCLSEQTEEDSGDDCVPEQTEEDSGDDSVPEQTEEDSGDDSVPEQTEEDSGDDCVPEQTEEDSGDDCVPEQTEEDSGDDCVPEQTEEDSGDDCVPEQTEEDSGDDCVPEQTDEDSKGDCVPEEIMGNGGCTDCRGSSIASKHKAVDELGPSTVAMDTKKNPTKPGASVEGPNTIQTDVESEGEKVIINSASEKPKRQYCLFCMKPVSKLSRHLQHKHQHIPEVVDAFGFPMGSKERTKHLQFIRNQGNFKHNTEVLKSGKGELVPSKRPSAARLHPANFMHCAYCQGLFKKQSLYRHLKSCKFIAQSVTVEVQSQCSGDVTSQKEVQSQYTGDVTSQKEVQSQCTGDVTSQKEVQSQCTVDVTSQKEVQSQCTGDVTSQKEVQSKCTGDNSSHQEVRSKCSGDNSSPQEVRSKCSGEDGGWSPRTSLPVIQLNAVQSENVLQESSRDLPETLHRKSLRISMMTSVPSYSKMDSGVDREEEFFPNEEEDGLDSDSSSLSGISEQKSLDEYDLDSDGPIAEAMETPSGEELNPNETDVKCKYEEVVIKSFLKNSNGCYQSKRKYCLYCLKPVSKFSRHLQNKHKHIPEVTDAFGFPKGSKDRIKRLQFIRNQGNLKHSTEVLKSGKGKVVPSKRPQAASKPEDFKQCGYCKGLFHKDSLGSHSWNCTDKPHSITTGPGNIRSTCSVASQITRRVWSMVNTMPVDDITAAIRKDRVIIQVGEQVLVKCRNSTNGTLEAIEKMRELGGLLTIAQKVSSFRNIEDFINAQKYMELTDCVKVACEYNSVTESYGRQALIDKLERDLVMVSRVLKARALAVNDVDSVDKATSFQDVHKERWSELVPSAATNPTVAQFTEDVQRLHLFLEEKHNEHMCELFREPSPESWAALVKVCLTQVFLFNLQHQHAVSSITVSDFLSRNTTCWSLGHSLTEMERILSRNFVKIVIKKSAASPALILLTPKMLSTLNSIVEKRGECGVGKENQYLFAQPSELSHYHGSECLLNFATVSGTRSPTALMNHELRSHAALLSTVLNLCTVDKGLLAELLGHDLTTHPEYYCPPVKTLRLATIAEVLLAREAGATGQFQGKSLDEIPVNLKEKVLVGVMRRRVAYDITECLSGKDGVMPTEAKKRKQQKDIPDPRPRKRSWRQEEVKAVERHMMALITSGRVPGSYDCNKCLLAEPSALANRNWKSIKFYVYNRIRAFRKHGMKSSK